MFLLAEVVAAEHLQVLYFTSLIEWRAVLLGPDCQVSDPRATQKLPGSHVDRNQVGVPYDKRQDEQEEENAYEEDEQDQQLEAVRQELIQLTFIRDYYLTAEKECH